MRKKNYNLEKQLYVVKIWGKRLGKKRGKINWGIKFYFPHKYRMTFLMYLQIMYDIFVVLFIQRKEVIR